MSAENLQISLLTGGGDRPYALGLSAALASAGVSIDFIGSNELDGPEVCNNPNIHFLNLRGDQRTNVGAAKKILRVLVYYFRLFVYAAKARPKTFHILWNNKFELFDRTLVIIFYRLLGKKIVFTAHNVNIRQRDGRDTWLNRRTLRFQYHSCDGIFVHTQKMQEELVSDFGVAREKVAVIPFGVNRTVPDTALTGAEARQRLGLGPSDKVILFFGNIAPYKGLEFLVAAFEIAAQEDEQLRLVVAGRPKGAEDYWAGLQEKINRSSVRDKMVLKIQYVPDEETEIYFKAADVLALPYTHIYQSGVVALGYGFGLPAIAADVGSMREEIVESKTGFICQPQNPASLAQALRNYFDSDLFRELPRRRAEIQKFAEERYSWSKVAAITTAVYAKLSGAIAASTTRPALQKT